MSQPFFITPQVVTQVIVTQVQPLVEHWMSSGLTGDNSKAVHVVFGNPGLPYSPEAQFPKHCLYNSSIIGDPADYKPKYAEIAMAKARMSWRTQMDTRTLVTSYPHLLLPNDVVWPGGVYAYGFPVGVSGFIAAHDEFFARAIAAALTAEAITLFEERRTELPHDSFLKEYM